MIKSFSFAKIFTLLLVFLLTNCAKVPDSGYYVNKIDKTPYDKPATEYLAMADQAEGVLKEALQIKAAGSLIHKGDTHEARKILTNLKRLPPNLNNEKELLLAKTDLIASRPKSAIAKVARVKNIRQMEPYQQYEYHQILADAYSAVGNYLESINERMKLDDFLGSYDESYANLQRLWETLTAISDNELKPMIIEADENSPIKGWMELLNASRAKYRSNRDLAHSIKNLQQDFMGHPAIGLIKTENLDKLYPIPQKVALLLPLTGSLSGPGNAIKDGFLEHAKESGTEVLIYNTDKENVAKLYFRALNDGAQYIIGPLAKNNASIVRKLSHPVPTLLLNDIQNTHSENIYEFGLSPKREAEQVAKQAFANGLRRVIIIGPEGNWGKQIIASFSAKWQSLGGQISDVLDFKDQDDFNSRIKTLLGVKNSEKRQKDIRNLLGKHIQPTPRIREDFDMVFLIAYPQKARQITPMLRYYYAGNIPIYATSSVYAGFENPRRDKDLEGVIFCDMPTLFIDKAKNSHWPEYLNSYSRLYALGYDSYSLTRDLNKLMLFPTQGNKSKSGLLYLNGQREVARQLEFAKFIKGKATPII